MGENSQIIWIVIAILIGAMIIPFLSNMDLSPFANAAVLQKVFTMIKTNGNQPTIHAKSANESLNFIGVNGVNFTTFNGNNTIRVNFTGNTQAFTFNNVGGGAGVWKNTIGLAVNYKSLYASSPLIATQNLNDITFSLPTVPWSLVNKTGSHLNDIGSPNANYDFGAKSLLNVNDVNATRVYQGGVRDINTLTAGAGISITGSGNSRTITNVGGIDTNTAQIGNSGNGFSLFGSRLNSTQNNLKTLRPGSGINLASNSTDITITSINSGTFTALQNIGHGGKGILTSSGTIIQGKNITSANGGITISSNGTDVLLTNTITDTNTAHAVNLFSTNGAGVGIFASNSNATRLQFKSLTCSGNVTCSNNSTNININVTAGSGGGSILNALNIGSPSQSVVFAGKSSSNLQFKGINATGGITLTNGSSLVTIGTSNIPWGNINKAGSILNDIGSPTSSYNFSNQRLTSLGTPILPTDAARANTIGNKQLSFYSNPTAGQVLTFNGTNSTAIWKTPDFVTENINYPLSYIVYKTGATYYAKNQTNFIVYSGTDATTVIQNALNHLTPNRTAKELVVLKGDFIIANTIFVPSYTALEIQGDLVAAPNIPPSGDSGSLVGPIMENADVVTGNTDIEIFDGMINGTYYSQTNADVINHDTYTIHWLNVKNLYFHDVKVMDGLEAIGLSNVDNAFITRNYFNNTDSDVIALDSLVTNTVVSWNVINNTNLYLGNPNVDGVELQDGCHDVLISENIISNLAGGGIDLVPHTTEFPTYAIQVVNNHISNIYQNPDFGHGIYVAYGTPQGTQGKNRQILITGNYINNTADDGIVVQASQFIRISNNIINQANLTGIRISSSNFTSVTNNQVTKFHTYGIDTFPTANYTWIAGNIVRNGQKFPNGTIAAASIGIRIAGNHTSVWNNLIESTDYSASSMKQGINQDASYYNDIMYNTVRNMRDVGIQASTATHFTNKVGNLVNNIPAADSLDTVSQKLFNSSASPPVKIERLTNSTNAGNSVLQLIAKNTNNGTLADGFGPLIFFQIRNNTGPATTLGNLEVVRDGDNSHGRLEYTSASGTAIFSIADVGDTAIRAGHKFCLGGITIGQLFGCSGTPNYLIYNSTVGLDIFSKNVKMIELNGSSSQKTIDFLSNKLLNAKLGDSLDLNAQTLKSSGHVYTFPSNTGTVCLTNQTGSCGSSSGVTSLTGTARNFTVSASTGAVTGNLGDSVVTTTGSNQTMLKGLNFTAGNMLVLQGDSKYPPIMLGTTTATPSTLADGMMWIRTDGAATMNYRAASGTQVVASTTLVQTLTSKTVNGLRLAFVYKTSDYTLTSGDSVVVASASGGLRTITLPTIVTSLIGQQIYTIIKNDSSTNFVMVKAGSGNTINGQNNFNLTKQYDSVTLMGGLSSYTKWHVLDNPRTGTTQLISNDETDSSGTVPNSDTNLKTYSLNSNACSQVMVEAEGEVDFVTLSTNQQINIKIKDGSTTKMTQHIDSALSATTTIPFTIKTAFAETSLKTIAITQGAAAADANTSTVLHSLRVYCIT